jgi:predicted PurR-regulated permease PerM
VQVPQRQIVFQRGVYIAAGVFALGYAMYLLRGVLTPLLIAFAIAYVFDPVVDRLEAWRIPRALGIAVVMLLLIAAVTLLVMLVIPSVVSDIAGVIVELPSHASRALARIEPWLAQYDIEVPHSTMEWVERLQGQANTIASSTLAPLRDALTWFVGGTFSVVGAIVAALIVPVFAVYLLYDFDRIVAGIRDLTPVRWRATVISYARQIDAVLGHFIRGQLIIMAILAVLYGGAYAALGVRLAIPIGIIAGLLNFIPYLGSAFALVSGLLMVLIGGGSLTQVIGVVVAYTVIQTLEGFVITPRVVGKTVGLRDVWVLFALFVGGELFGFMGVLLALPMAAVAKIFIARALVAYRSTNLFLGGSGHVIVPPASASIAGAGSPPAEQSSGEKPDP